MINRTNTILPKSHADVEEKVQATPNVSLSTIAPPKLPKRLIAPELMTAFAAAVRGSDLTKAGLIEMLKKQYVHQMFFFFSLFFPLHYLPLFRFYSFLVLCLEVCELYANPNHAKPDSQNKPKTQSKTR